MKFISRILSFLSDHTVCIIDGNTQKFKNYPRMVVWLVLFLSYNVILQGIADVVIKILSMAEVIFYVSFRVDFIFLTMVSVLMGYQALRAMQRREVDVTRNSVALGLIVELGLVLSDVFHLINLETLDYNLLWLRMPFIVVTSINFLILIYIAIRLKVFINEKGKFVLS